MIWQKTWSNCNIMLFQIHNILEYIPTPNKQFTLYSVNHENKQTVSEKDKSQDEYKTFYIHVL